MEKINLLPFVLLWAGCGGRADLGGTGESDARAPIETSPKAPSQDARPQDDSHEPGGFDASKENPLVDAATDASVGTDAGRSARADAAPLSLDAATLCDDDRKDGDETDVDCGGVCGGCGPRKACLADSDCSATASGCDAQQGGCFCDAVSSTCVYNHCFDHKHDDDEPATDCGGATCSPCALGQGCLVDGDCVSMACDGVSHLCVANQCSDHRKDGMESDTDCGGDTCNGCMLNQMCHDAYDCELGTCRAIPAGGYACL